MGKGYDCEEERRKSDWKSKYGIVCRTWKTDIYHFIFVFVVVVLGDYYLIIDGLIAGLDISRPGAVW